MTDMSTKVRKGNKGDATVLMPTMMCAVPLIMDRYEPVLFNILLEQSYRLGIFKTIYMLLDDYILLI